MLSFSNPDQARELLSRSDAFTSRLGPFELQARMKNNCPVSEKEFLAFAAACALSWQKREITDLKTIIRNLETRLYKYLPLFPTEILLIKTDGREEAGCAYTRQNAVILPPDKLAYPVERLERFLAHELFHILSRHQPVLRSELYGLLGFQPCNEIEWPQELLKRRITNPDSPYNDHYILLDYLGIERAFVPVLYSRSKEYNAQEAIPYFSNLVSRFMALALQGHVWRPDLSNGQPLLADLSEVLGFQKQINRMTDRIDQPEEILAEDFVHFLWNDPSAAAPRVQEDMRKIFSSLNKQL